MQPLLRLHFLLFLAAAGITLGFAVAAVIMMAAMVPGGFWLFLAIGLGFGRLFGFFSLGLLLGFGCLGSFGSGTAEKTWPA